MREILFRAKAINRDKGYHRTDYKNGDWVYGIITKLYDERFENLPAEMRDVDGVNGIDVDYKTVGQYTGLTDKNGAKIFEGDIIRALMDFGPAGLLERIALVGWHDKYGYQWNYFDTDTIEVIGNIHDNPELLGGAENG